MITKFQNIILECAKEGITDIHLTGDHPLVFRHNGNINTKPHTRFSPNELDALACKLLTPAQLCTLQSQYSVDFAISIKHVRVRVNIFTTWRGLSYAVRILPGTIPSLSLLNLLPVFSEIIKMKEGLVLFCGPTGSGKTTTIAGIINEMNKERAAHIITLEDPIEYRFPSAQSFIQQRELGKHFPSFKQGLVDVLREDPDIILVGELRDSETMRLALDAAESGHLVIATLHAASPEETLLRIINSFESNSQEFARTQLAAVLQAIFVQKLCYEEKIGFRVPILSVLHSNAAIRTIIREDKTSQLFSVQQLHATHDMHTPESYKEKLFQEIKQFRHPDESLRPSFELVNEQSVSSAIFTQQVKATADGLASNSVDEATCPTTEQSLTEDFNRYIEELGTFNS